MAIGVTPNGTFTQAKHISFLDINDFINYPNGLGLSTSSPLYTSGMLQKICDAACAFIEKYCNRYFVQQTIDEITPDLEIRQGHYITVWLRNSPIISINGINLQSFKYFIPFDLSYMTLFQHEGYYSIIPFLSSNIGTGADFIPANNLNSGECNLWTNYTFGYDINSIPEPVYQAACLQATKLVANSQNPLGATDLKMGNTEFRYNLSTGQEDMITTQIQALLAPYKSIPLYTV